MKLLKQYKQTIIVIIFQALILFMTVPTATTWILFGILDGVLITLEYYNFGNKVRR